MQKRELRFRHQADMLLGFLLFLCEQSVQHFPGLGADFINSLSRISSMRLVFKLR